LLNHPLDYPYDKVNQAEHKGQNLFTHYTPDGQATGASNCWQKWLAVAAEFLDVFGFLVPIIGTEGGAWPHKGSYLYDSRYPALDAQAASDRTATILHGMSTAPRFFMAMCPWLWANRAWGNPSTAFEWQAWHQLPGWGTPPAPGPEWQPIVATLQATPCQPRPALAPVATPPQPAPAPQPTPPAKTPPTDTTAVRQLTARQARWNAEEAVREIQSGHPSAARERLLVHVIPRLYSLEGATQ